MRRLAAILPALAVFILPASASALTVKSSLSERVSLTASGQYLPLKGSCSGYVRLSSCRVELLASQALIKSRLSRDVSSPYVRIARASGVGSISLRLTTTGRELLRSQPGGIRVRLAAEASSRSGRQGRSERRARLSLSGRLALPDGVFQPGRGILDPAGARALSSLSESLPRRVSRLTCTGYRSPVAAPVRGRGKGAGRRYRRAVKDYRARLDREKRLAASRARTACAGLPARSRRVRLASGRSGVSLRLSYPRPAIDSLPDLGIHSMIQPSMSEEEIAMTMAAARQAGIEMVRFDLPVNYIGQYLHVYPGMYDFSFLDMVRRHATENGVELLAVATWAPQPMTECSQDDGYRCAPRDPEAWAQVVAAAAAHAPEIDHFEIWNEPNTRYFKGSEEQYVDLLRAASRALKAQSADNRVLIGGPASLGLSWLARVLPGARGHYDIAAVHVRPRSGRAARSIERARDAFRRGGFEGELWVTEFGYPSDPARQYDSLFDGGPADQADYYTQALGQMKGAGAGRVFVTGRDAPEYDELSPFRSEGLWSFSGGELLFKDAYWRLAEAG